MNKEQLKELLEGLTDSFTQVANTITNVKKEPGERRELTHAKPIRQHFYRTSPDEQEFIDKELVDMEKQGLIQKSKSPWASPVVIVPKKGEHRAGRIHNNADSLSRSQEPKKEKRKFKQLVEKDKEQTELDWLINLAEYDEYDKYNNYWTESEDSNKEWTEPDPNITYDYETEWDWWNINKNEELENYTEKEAEYEELLRALTIESSRAITWSEQNGYQHMVNNKQEINDTLKKLDELYNISIPTWGKIGLELYATETFIQY
ncbi:10479_t:CDS:2 [Scutellospora calospora]|uniref:10479_t:CDS:1 n=1 Tax=Scutellospora calospora TaxID=85575 RepID=A0ACA9K875_9GLOM|nr:10479_t:CDS:2 [Scutellospora calospora]